MPFLLGIIMITLAALSTPSAAGASFLHGTIWEQAADEQGVDPVLLYSVTLLESARQVGEGRIKPWPYAIGVNGYNLSLYPQSRQEAEAILSYLISLGITNVDIGLGQVNLPSHAHCVGHWSELLDPQKNLRVAAAILKEALESTADLVLGVGHYHSWTHWRAAAYGRKVLDLYQRLLTYSGTQPPWRTHQVLPAAAAPPLAQQVMALNRLLPQPSGLFSPLWPEGRLEFKILPIRRIGGSSWQIGKE